MTEQVHEITDAPKKDETKKKVKKAVAVGIFAAGIILLIDDQVRRFSRKSEETEETPEEN